ncbi:serine hydrolase [Microtetraspora sp. NBRC 13810]|nr:serine hydrolase [Microtetraspora sp. NBRC 13810]
MLGLRGAAPASAPGARSVPADLGPGGAYDRFIASQAAKDEFSGTVLLTHQGRTVLSRSFGMADRRRSIRNGPDTRFALASATKLFTAVAIHQQAQRGAIAYHDKLGAYLDGFPPETADVTVHQLLTHTSGLGNYRETQEFKDGARAWADAAEVNDGIMAIIRRTPPAFTPGTRVQYSNSGYELLGAIVARTSGLSYYDHVREHVFGPAGMTDTDWYTRPQWNDDRRFAHPYATQPSGERADVIADKTFIGTAAGDAFSTGPDLDRFARALMGGELLDPAHTRIVLSAKQGLPRWADSPDAPAPGAAFQGYGPLALLFGEQWMFLHNGGSAGEGAYVEMYPGTGWVSVVLGNYDVRSVVPVAVMARRLITAQQPTQ